MSCSTCFGQPCAHPQELTTQWFYRRVWCSAVAAEGCQNGLAGCVSIEEYVAQQVVLHNRRERDHWGDLGVDGWIILGWISRRWDVGIWTGLGWPRIETAGGRL